MNSRTKYRLITISVLGLSLILVNYIGSCGALYWLAGAGYISPETLASLNKTMYYPLTMYRQSTLLGADALNERYYKCLEAGWESKAYGDQ